MFDKIVPANKKPKTKTNNNNNKKQTILMNWLCPSNYLSVSQYFGVKITFAFQLN